MTHEQEQEQAARARAIAESLIPAHLRDSEWKPRWDGLEAILTAGLSDAGLHDAYVQIDQEFGERGQDVLATACLIRDVDV